MRRAFLAVVLAGVAASAHAQAAQAQSAGVVSGEPQVPEKAGKELHAYRITGQPPRVDGRLDDEAWLSAQTIDDFVQNEPDNMAAPRERTTIQIAYTDRALYVGVHCFMRNPGDITTGLGRRDSLPPSDLIRVGFDPRHDHQTAYFFDTNPSGMQSDYLFYDDTRQSNDFDAVWEVRTTVGPDGWSAEYEIPFSQLRFQVTPGVRTVWGFNVRRDVYKFGEFDRWVPTPRGAAGFVSRFGHLIFDETLAPPRRVELLPFTLARREQSTAAGTEHSVSGGLDARLGVGTGATLSATVNPDFAQVEQDPAVLNLSVFETFYPEKRPFFVEDSRLFVPPYSQMILFHSRRIGRSPGRFSVPSNVTELSRPDATTILGAAKLTGKGGGWNYGAISAMTAAEYAVVKPTGATGATEPSLVPATKQLIEPQTLYNVGRVQRDLRGGTSNIGGIATAVLRDGDADAFVGGADYTFRWDRSRGSLNGQWAGSHAPFSVTTRDMRDGFGGITNFNYGRKHFAVNGHYDYISPNFRINDTGFLSSRVDKTNVNYGFNLLQPDPRGVFRNVNWYSYASQSWNHEQLVFENYVGSGVDMTYRNFSSLFVEVQHNFERYDDLDSRGGPPIFKPSSWGFYTGGRTDSRKTLQVSFNVNAQRDAEGGWNVNLSPTLRVQPSSELAVSLSAQYQPGQDVAQWITNTDATGDGVTDYVYGRLQRHVVSLTARATYAFSRDMTLEAYLQPFVAVGDYSDIRRLAQPKSFEFEPVTLPTNPDFNTKSLRSNVVYRWEYVKGSTLFVVWNMSRQDAARPGVFAPWRDLGDAFSGQGTHVFMVKVNYWLGL